MGEMATVADLTWQTVPPGLVQDSKTMPLLCGADNEISNEVRRQVEENRRYVRLRTNGNGACALHAAFGRVAPESLFLQGARNVAVTALGKAFEANARGEILSTRFSSVLASLWSEFARQMSQLASINENVGRGKSIIGIASKVKASNINASSEARCVWSYLSDAAKDVCINQIEGEREEIKEDEEYLATLDQLGREFCTPQYEISCRKIGARLSHLPDYSTNWYDNSIQFSKDDEGNLVQADWLESPYRWSASTKKFIIKGSQNEECPDVEAESYSHKYRALFDSRPCFDVLRRSFFITYRKSSPGHSDHHRKRSGFVTGNTSHGETSSAP